MVKISTIQQAHSKSSAIASQVYPDQSSPGVNVAFVRLQSDAEICRRFGALTYFLRALAHKVLPSCRKKLAYLATDAPVLL